MWIDSVNALQWGGDFPLPPPPPPRIITYGAAHFLKSEPSQWVLCCLALFDASLNYINIYIDQPEWQYKFCACGFSTNYII